MHFRSIIKKKPFLIAEIGWNFLGDIKLAKKMIREAKNSGADSVKIQTFDCNNLRKGPWDHDGRRKLYKRSSMTLEKYKKLHEYAKQKKIIFFSSFFNRKDLIKYKSIDNYIIKIASSECTNIDLINLALKYFKNVIISTGMTNRKDLKKLLRYKNNKKVFFLHCVSSYPLDHKNCNFQKFFYLKNNFNNHIGYSGHANGIEDAIFALSNGAKIIEKHFTIDRNLMGKDNQFSITGKEMKEIVKWRNLITQMNINKGLEIQNSEKASLSFKGRWNKDN